MDQPASDLIRLAAVRRRVESGEARRLREASGITGPEMAAAVGVGTPTLWRWENGQRRPRGAAALRYGELLEQLAQMSAPTQEAVTHGA